MEEDYTGNIRLLFKRRIYDSLAAPLNFLATGKILYWGPAASGTTTCLSTLYRKTQAGDFDVKPVGDLKAIAMASGATLILLFWG